jgi:hypothetical protein
MGNSPSYFVSLWRLSLLIHRWILFERLSKLRNPSLVLVSEVEGFRALVHLNFVVGTPEKTANTETSAQAATR